MLGRWRKPHDYSDLEGRRRRRKTASKHHNPEIVETQQLLHNSEHQEQEDDADDKNYQPKLCVPLIRWKVRDVDLERPLFPVCWPQPAAGAFPVKTPLYGTDSFETQSTTEDVSETSIVVEQMKTIRWRDHEQSALHTVHEYDAEPSAYCRVIVLLCLNQGRRYRRAQNFEFLHCEFPYYERLTVSDTLRQISHLSLSSPSSSSKRKFQHLFLPPDDDNNKQQSYIELIHALPIQDYHLVDGQSILICMRNGPDSLEQLQLQSQLLLQDDILRLELRKARIAGRSVQTLYGSVAWRAQRKQKTSTETLRTALSFGDFEEWNPDDDGTASTNFRFLSFEDTPQG